MDNSKKKGIRKNIREIALTIFFSGLGLLICMVLRRIGLSELVSSIIAFTIAAVAVFLLFPKVLGIPFGKIEVSEWVRRIGLHPPQGAWKHIVLGILLAACTLSGMYIGSYLTGKYEFDLGNVTVSHMVFSLIPAFFEELLIRGVLMITLLRITRSLEKAFAIQVVIFGLMHIKGIDLISFVEVLSVSIIAISFTYAVYKTGSLLAAIVFHYLHDAFLFLVQLPDGVYQGFSENALFYAGLWSMVGLSLLVTKVAADMLHVRAKVPVYERSHS